MAGFEPIFELSEKLIVFFLTVAGSITTAAAATGCRRPLACITLCLNCLVQLLAATMQQLNTAYTCVVLNTVKLRIINMYDTFPVIYNHAIPTFFDVCVALSALAVEGGLPRR